MAACQREDQEQEGFRKQRKRILAMQFTIAAPADQKCTGAGAGKESEYGDQAFERQGNASRSELSGGGRDDTRHVGCVLMNGEEAAGVRSARDEGEISRDV